jgi:ubiquinone/menaquinone biosynthesis C-methylase UbiE
MAPSDRLLSPPPELTIDPDAFNAFEAAGWQRTASTYDPIAAITSRVITPLLDAARVGQGMRVLDIGSGPGHAAAQAAQRGAAVVGIDVATAMIQLARRLHPGLDFREANAEALPFEDDCFDAVVGNFSVVHLGRPEQAVGEFVRVLKAGGQLALTVWDLPQRARWQGVFLDAVAAVDVTAPADVPPGPAFFRFSVDEQFAALLQDCGLTDVEVTTIAFDHPMPTADEWWDGVLAGTVRVSALILRQHEPARQRIRAVFDQLVTEYQRGDHLEVPVSVKLAAGSKPR